MQSEETVQPTEVVQESKDRQGLYGPRVKPGEHVFGICHIYASFNDTFVVRA